MSPAAYDILILDDGELGEIRSAAAALGAAVHTDIDAPNTPVSWPLVVTNHRHLDELDATPVDLNAKRLVVLDRLSRTMRTRMKRSRIDFFLQRPVHPEALRLLLMHCLYQGPERRQRRVAVGLTIRFRQGFRRGAGVLADLSDAGCRILSDDPLEVGARPLVFLPRPQNPLRSFYVRAEVVRVQKRPGRQPEMALHFKGLNRSARGRIEELLALYDEGPAVFQGDDPGTLEVTRPDTTVQSAPATREKSSAPALARPNPSCEEGDGAVAGPEGAVGEAPALEPVPAARAGAPAGHEHEGEAVDAEIEAALAERVRSAETPARKAPPERRREPRREFDRQVVALDRSATRVLVGRDLSVGGMRVDHNDALILRKSFRLSIHVREGELPLVLRARVARDDGDEGIVLRFAPLAFAVQEQLRKSLRELPIQVSGEGGEPEAVLIGEVIDDEVADDFGDEAATA